MNDSPFEKRLREQGFREIPSSWKAEILSRVSEQLPAQARRQRKGSPLLDWMRELLWPSPVAWGALACLWILPSIANLGYSQAPSRSVKPPSTIEQRLVREQREFLTEQFGTVGLPVGWKVSKTAPSREEPQPGSEGALGPAMLNHTGHDWNKGNTYET